MSIHYTLTPEAATVEAQAGRDSRIHREELPQLSTEETWKLLGRDLIRPRDLLADGLLRRVPPLPAQGHVLNYTEAATLAKQMLVERNERADSAARAWCEDVKTRTTEMSALEESGGVMVRVVWKQVFVDDMYRPNPEHMSAAVAQDVNLVYRAHVERCARATEAAKVAAYAQLPTLVEAEKARKATKAALADKRRRWLVATEPQWRSAIDHEILSDSGVSAEVALAILRALGLMLQAQVDNSLEVLSVAAHVLDEDDKVEPRSTPRRLAQMAARAKDALLSSVPGLVLRAWEPEAVYSSQFPDEVAHTVRVVLWCEAAATEVRGRIVLDRGEA